MGVVVPHTPDDDHEGPSAAESGSGAMEGPEHHQMQEPNEASALSAAPAPPPQMISEHSFLPPALPMLGYFEGDDFGVKRPKTVKVVPPSPGDIALKEQHALLEILNNPVEVDLFPKQAEEKKRLRGKALDLKEDLLVDSSRLGKRKPRCYQRIPSQNFIFC